MKTFVAFVIIIMLAVTTSSAQENRVTIDKPTTRPGSDVIPEARPLAQGEGIEYISSCLWSDLSDFRVENGKLYCAFTYGLVILDASTGPPFETISTLYLPSTYGRGDQLEKHGDYVYFTRGSELLVIDVSDVSHPSVVGSYPSQEEVRDVLYADGALYLREYRNGLTILDVSDPANPSFLSTTTAFGDWLDYLSVSGGIAVTGDYKEFMILDVSDRTAPALLSSRELSNLRNAIVGDDLLFTFQIVYGEPDSLVIYDVSNPADPSIVGVHVPSDPEISSSTMMLNGSLLFTAGEIIDISDPSSPVPVSEYLSAYIGGPLGIEGNTLYMSQNTALFTFDIADVENPYRTGQHVLPGFITDVHVQGDIAYVGARYQGLSILDISDIYHPVVLSELESPFGFDAFDVQDDILFSGRYVVDVGDPANPVILADIFGVQFLDVRLHGDLGYSIGVPFGLSAFDLSDPSDPKLLSTHTAMFDFRASLAVKDNLVFFTPSGADATIHILDYSDPTAPELVGKYGPPDPSSWNIAVAVDGDIMYTMVSDALHVVDVHDPRNPVMIGIYDEFNLWFPFVMVPKGGILYTTDRYGNTIVFDVSDPTNPLFLENFETPSQSTQNLFVDGQRLYLADYYGLMIAHTPYGVPPVQQVALDIKPGSCPNPLNVTTPKGDKANGGVLPVAVLGNDEFDVRDIDVSSLELAGVAPLRHSFKDVATPPNVDVDCACSEAGPDGYTDLELKFNRLDVVAGLGSVSGGDVPVMLTGQKKDGTPIEGTDCVRIVPKEGDGGLQLRSSEAAAVTALGPATPNPFNPTTVIGYELAEREHVTLSVYDVTGRLVVSLVNEEVSEGRHQVTWEAAGIASGVYFYRLQAGDFVQTRRMVLLK